MPKTTEKNGLGELSMKIGSLVRVKDSVGYNSYMQNLVGHIGVTLVVGIGCWVHVHILGKTRPIMINDLEVIDENR